MNSKKDAARIGHNVGKLKRGVILTKAIELGIKVLNPGKDSKIQTQSKVKDSE